MRGMGAGAASLCSLVAYRCGRERREETESGESGDGLFFTSLNFGWIGIWEELFGIGSGLPSYWVTHFLLRIPLRFFLFLLKKTLFRALFYLICVAG